MNESSRRLVPTKPYKYKYNSTKSTASSKLTKPYFVLNSKRVAVRGPIVPFGLLHRTNDKRWVRARSPLGEIRLVYSTATKYHQMKRFLFGVMAGGPTYQTVAAQLTCVDTKAVSFNVHSSSYVRFYDSANQLLDSIAAFKLDQVTKTRQGISISGQVVVAQHNSAARSQAVTPVFVEGTMRVSKKALARSQMGCTLGCTLGCTPCSIVGLMTRWMCEPDRRTLMSTLVAEERGNL
jgi:hypothetical protein